MFNGQLSAELHLAACDLQFLLLYHEGDGVLDECHVAADGVEVGDGMWQSVAEDLLDAFLHAEDVVVTVAIVFASQAHVALTAVVGVALAEVAEQLPASADVVVAEVIDDAVDTLSIVFLSVGVNDGWQLYALGVYPRHGEGDGGCISVRYKTDDVALGQLDECVIDSVVVVTGDVRDECLFDEHVVSEHTGVGAQNRLNDVVGLLVAGMESVEGLFGDGEFQSRLEFLFFLIVDVTSSREDTQCAVGVDGELSEPLTEEFEREVVGVSVAFA